MINYDCANFIIAFTALVLFMVIERHNLSEAVNKYIFPINNLGLSGWLGLLTLLLFLVGLFFGGFSELIAVLKMIIRGESYQFSQVVAGIDWRQTSRLFMIFSGLSGLIFGISFISDSDWRLTASPREWILILLILALFGIMLYLNLIGLIQLL